MKINEIQLKNLLVENNLISEKDFSKLEKEAEEKEISIVQYLSFSDVVPDSSLGKLIADHFGFNFIDLEKHKIEEKVLRLIPELMARAKNAIVFEEGSKTIKVGMREPNNKEVIKLIEKEVGKEVVPYFITPKSFKIGLSKYEIGLKKEIDQILEKAEDEPTKKKGDSIVRLVDTLLVYGYKNNASDIHVEPYPDKILVRFRIDGVLHDVLELPKELLGSIVTRIKILSQMRIDEHKATQDGKMNFQIDDKRIDIRVSIVPVTEGENVVMRLLVAKNQLFDLQGLGLSGESLARVNRAVKSSQGMILATGPTGSGKTTTLYAVMKILNTRKVHVSTIEDPVEYSIKGVSQIQVNPKANLTFAKGLRSIVRQDPDIIMVGEIRDEETADIAVNSALTGHLVLSTLHTNDASTTLPRLLDMGIEPFLVASTVNVVIAQRLVRKVCEHCKTSYPLSLEEKKLVESIPEVRKIFEEKDYSDLDKVNLYKGTGCKKCTNTGYTGRIGIFEVLEVDKDIKKLILQKESSSNITEKARENGMITMIEDGLEKVFAGETTLSEVLRVIRR
jgi:type IV pilus assembly protein PilB